LETEKIDGLFVDVFMPHVDGLILTQRVRNSRLNRRVPIVMLTGSDDGETMRKSFEAGANFFLGKPFTRERVYNLLGATRGSMLKERQRYTRLPYRTEVDCTWGTEPLRHSRTFSVNLSEGGMKLTPPGGLAIGQELEVAFNLPGIPHITKAHARVVREAPPNGIGIQFLKLNTQDEKDLQGYVSARLLE
jgi:CheY-like chemotaxis protein